MMRIAPYPPRTHHTARESRANKALRSWAKRRSSELAHNRSSPNSSGGTRGAKPARFRNATPFSSCSCVQRKPGATTSTTSPALSRGDLGI